jgi:Cu+-exporting ATPase
VRNAEALETLSRVDTLVVDKTGTLTAGKPEVVDILPALAKPEEIVRLAASVEQASEHPLAAAVVGEARRRGIGLAPVERFEARPGAGVVGTVDGRRVAFGTRALVDASARPGGASTDTPVRPGTTSAATPAAGRGPDAAQELDAAAERLRAAGRTVMYLAADGRVLGAVAVADPVKPSTPDALRALRDEGLRVVMLTGDNRATATAVARELGLDEVVAEVLPAAKRDFVRELQDAGHIVAMAGDGINDAPALAQADVGIAMGTGADVAVESAGITLVQGDLRGIVRARRLSRATLRNIRENLCFAFGYNLLGIPIAAGVLYPVVGWLLNPMIAAAAMSLSSVSVIANALRLRRAAL